MVAGEDAVTYRAAWLLANEAERVELRALEPGAKFAQLVSLFEAARALGFTQPDQAGDAEVRRTWQRLRDNAGCR